MMKQMKLLSKIELCNLFGINVFRHTKDKKAKKKSIAMALTIGVLLIMAMSYIVTLSYGLITLEAESVIPAYLITIASFLTLAFSTFKTGAVIFRKKGYDILASLPFTNKAIVASRFLRLYVENLMVTSLIVLPGLIVYAIFIHPGFLFYVIGILSIFVIPLIPVTIASGIGVLITGLSSRMKHQALVEAGISILFVLILTFGSFLFSENANEITTDMIKNLADMVTDVLGKVYPPAVILGNAIVQGDILRFLLLSIVSLGLFFVVIWIVSAKFDTICRRLHSTSAKHNYKIKKLEKHSVLKTLVLREAKRYFASGTYVTNTIIGPVMGTAFSVGLHFMNLESITVPIPISMNVKEAVPLVIAAIFTIMNATSVSISMEGKEWWIIKTLPLRTKTILDGKLLFNLCLQMPFYVVSVISALIALKPNVMGMMWTILVPALLILFSSVFGITANLQFPKLDWENEVNVVKQSASSAIGGMSGLIIAIPCILAVLFVPAQFANFINGVICICLVIATTLLYQKNNKADLKML